MTGAADPSHSGRREPSEAPPEELITLVRTVVDLLVRGEFQSLAAMTRERRLTAEQMKAAVESYGRRLAPPPDDAWDLIDAVRVRGPRHATYDVEFPLWTEEEGRSDLSLSLTIKWFTPGLFEAEIDDIHVL